MLMELSEIDVLIASAKREKATYEVRKLQGELEALRMDQRRDRDALKAIADKVLPFEARKKTFEGKKKELEALREFVPDAKFEDAMKSLDDLIAEQELEIEVVDTDRINLSLAVENREKELAVLESKLLDYREREHAPLPVVQPTPELTEDDADAQLKYHAAEVGLVKLMTGKKLTFYGGLKSRGSAQALQTFTAKTLQLRKCEWFNGRDDMDRLVQSIANGGVDCFVQFTQMSNHCPHVLRACRDRSVPVVLLTSPGKAQVLKGIAEAQGLKW